MAWEQSDLLTLGGVVAILAGMLLWNAFMASRPAPKAETAVAVDEALLCKFVTHEGSVVGETVAREGQDVILKQSGVFKAVPAAHLEPDGGELRLRGPVDWVAAEAAGAAWYDRVKGEGSEEVAGTMTRSEDVRAPALEALRQREGVAGSGAPEPRDDSEE